MGRGEGEVTFVVGAREDALGAFLRLGKCRVDVPSSFKPKPSSQGVTGLGDTRVGAVSNVPKA